MQEVLVLKKFEDGAWLDHNRWRLAHFLTLHFQNHPRAEDSLEADCRTVENAKDRFIHWKQWELL